MEKSNIDDIIARLSRILLQNDKMIINEKDLINLCSSIDEYNQVLPEIVKNFKKMGLSLVRSQEQNERYLVLTTPGKDENISPSMYGTLALLIATYNEIGNNIELGKIKEIFKEVWEEIDQLMENGYLNIINLENIEYLSITPVGKAAFKNVIKNINLKNLID